MDNSKRLTLEALVAKAEQRRQEKFETHQVEVPSLGGALQLEKIPLTRIASMMDDLGDTSMSANLAFNVDLIYACCPMLRNTKLQAAYEVAENFNAIGSCIRKEYTYRIYNSRIKNPFYVDRAYFYPKRLDEQVMDRAARAFEGTHDFAAVRSVGTNVRSTVRTIYYCHVTRNGELLELKVCANGFLYNMVRAITGTVLYAAEGKLRPEDIPVILDSGNRTLAGPTAPPGGLYLTRVWYEDERLNG